MPQTVCQKLEFFQPPQRGSVEEWAERELALVCYGFVGESNRPLPRRVRRVALHEVKPLRGLGGLVADVRRAKVSREQRQRLARVVVTMLTSGLDVELDAPVGVK